MNKKFAKKLFRVFLLSLIGLPLINVTATVPYPPKSAANERKTIFLGVDIEQKQVIIHTLCGGKKVDFNLSFPAEGGIRLHTDCTGEQKPAALTAVTYEQAAENRWIFHGKNGTDAELQAGSEWVLSVKNGSGETLYSVSSSQIKLGYNDGTAEKVSLSGKLYTDEVIYGFGEQFRSFNQVGDKIILWNADDWSQNAYKNIPFFHSSTGYSLFFNSGFYGEADMGSTDPNSYTMTFEGPDFDFYVWTGTPLENIKSYTKLTGRQCTSPKWAFRYWAGGTTLFYEGYNPDVYLEKLSKMLEGYKNLGVDSLGVVFGEDSLFRDIRSYDILKTVGANLIAWNMPRASQADMLAYCRDWTDDPERYDLPYFKKLTSNEYYSTLNIPIDFTHPNAAKYIKAQWGPFISQGVKGMMCDFGELVEYDVSAYNGMSGSELHNLYAYYYTKTFNEVFSSIYPNGDFFLFSRAGSPGSQKYAATFSADQHGDFDGLRKVVNAGIGINASGFSTWGSDIGGIDTTSSSEVYARWMQFGAFSPLMRVHGSGDNNPSAFGEVGAKTFQIHYWLRENLLDYIYSRSLEANKTGNPMMKSLAVAYNNDSRLAGIDDEYIFCDDFLVCPVLIENARSREVVLPEGTWCNLWDGSVIEGGQTVTADAPITYSPVYLRSGAIIPVTLAADTLELTDSMQDKTTVQGLAVTAPECGETKTYTHWYNKAEKAEFTSVGGAGGFCLKAENSNLRIISACGVSARNVFADGAALKQLSQMPIDGQVGFYVDGNRKTVISLGDNCSWSEIQIVNGDKPCKLQSGTENCTVKVNGTKTQALQDMDKTTFAETGIGKTEITFSLKDQCTVDSAVLRYTEDVCTECSVFTSLDGKSWIKAGEISGSIAETQWIKLLPTCAKYVKITDFSQEKTGKIFSCELFGQTDSGLVQDVTVKVPCGVYGNADFLPETVMMLDDDGNRVKANVTWDTSSLFANGPLALSVTDTVTVYGSSVGGVDENNSPVTYESRQICCTVCAVSVNRWDFESNDLNAELQGLNTYVRSGSKLTKADAADVWTLDVGKEFIRKTDGYIICKASNQPEYGTLLTEREYTDFEITATIRGGYVGGSAQFPMIMFGVKNPTEYHMASQSGGYAVIFQSEIGRIALRGYGLGEDKNIYLSTDSVSGWNKSKHYYASNIVMRYTVRVQGNILTVGVCSADDQNIYGTASYALPQSICGQVGICFSANSDPKWSYSQIFDLSVEDKSSPAAGDVTGDNRVNIVDLVRLKKYCAGITGTVLNKKAMALDWKNSGMAEDLCILRKMLLNMVS